MRLVTVGSSLPARKTDRILLTGARFASSGAYGTRAAKAALVKNGSAKGEELTRLVGARRP